MAGSEMEEGRKKVRRWKGRNGRSNKEGSEVEKGDRRTAGRKEGSEVAEGG